MALSNYYEAAVLKHVLGIESLAMPATLYVGLFEAVDGLEVDDWYAQIEITNAGYARLAVSPSQITVSTDGSGVTTAKNNAKLEFNPATENWATITHVAITDHIDAGHIIAWFALPAPLSTVVTGNIVRLNINSMTLTID